MAHLRFWFQWTELTLVLECTYPHYDVFFMVHTIKDLLVFLICFGRTLLQTLFDQRQPRFGHPASLLFKNMNRKTYSSKIPLSTKVGWGTYCTSYTMCGVISIILAKYMIQEIYIMVVK